MSSIQEEFDALRAVARELHKKGVKRDNIHAVLIDMNDSLSTPFQRREIHNIAHGTL